MKSNILDEIIIKIENDDIKKFAEELLTTIPEYFYHAPSSSTGKYHPAYALGEGGLARHTLALVRLLNHTFDVECMGSGWTSREKDLMRVAGMMHDTRKSGSQEDYEQNKYTKFEHPLMAAEVIRGYKGKGYIPDDEIEIVASAVESHMGAFCTDKRSSTVLPTPKNKYQKMIHWADYLASRKDIEMRFDSSIPTPEEYRFTFDKHNGQTLQEVIDTDPSYIDWLKTTELRFPLDQLLTNL